MSPKTRSVADNESEENRTVEILGLNAGGYWANNQEHFGPPGHLSVMLLFVLANGQPVALVAANAITSLRTGAPPGTSRGRTQSLAQGGAKGECRSRLSVK
ncbi:MAG: hypothetical protein ACC700_15475 [Anaerolineales bacterium]